MKAFGFLIVCAAKAGIDLASWQWFAWGVPFWIGGFLAMYPSKDS